MAPALGYAQNFSSDVLVFRTVPRPPARKCAFWLEENAQIESGARKSMCGLAGIRAQSGIQRREASPSGLFDPRLHGGQRAP